MKPDYEIIVVGARIAGSILSTLLGEWGHRILVLDRASFPSDTLSTHFFRWPALTAFKRAGIFAEVQDAAPHLAVLYTDIDGHVISEPVQGQDNLDYFLCVRRITLDWILVQRMQQEPGIEFRQGARVKNLLWDADRVVGVKWEEDGQPFESRARLVVGADGKYSQVAREVQPVIEHSQPVQRAMYYTYFHGLDSLSGPAAEHYFRGNNLVYVFPTDNDLTLVAISVPIADFAVFRQDSEGQLMARLESLEALAPRLRRAERVAPVKGAGNIPCYQRVPYGPGWVLVGDAAQILDPWSGQGIDHAGTHAVMLAEALHTFLSEEAPWDAAMAGYHSSRNNWSRKTYQRTISYARDLRPMTRAALVKRGIA